MIDEALYDTKGSARRTSRLHVIVLSPDLVNFMHTSKVDFKILRQKSISVKSFVSLHP